MTPLRPHPLEQKCSRPREQTAFAAIRKANGTNVHGVPFSVKASDKGAPVAFCTPRALGKL